MLAKKPAINKLTISKNRIVGKRRTKKLTVFPNAIREITMSKTCFFIGFKGRNSINLV
jgi:hypothetical protein